MINANSVMIDIEGKDLTSDDQELLAHPAVGGIILFARNYESPEQLIHLTTQIHQIKQPLMIAVDQEGGRVQRFQQGFTKLPPMRDLGVLYDKNPEEALRESRHLGWTMASELRAVGIDCSFAPVLDIDAGVSGVIGNRAFHSNPSIIGELASAFVDGMHEVGLIAVGKHFPGHGHVAPDSHIAVPVDERELSVILEKDVLPFKHLIQAGVDGIMPAHIIYEKVDQYPAGFSEFWLKKQLRDALGFNGIIFSDDLTMEGAAPMGNYAERAERAIHAGCDMVLVCNNRQAAIEVIQQYEHS